MKERAARPQTDGSFWFSFWIVLWTANVISKIIFEEWHIKAWQPWYFVIGLLVYGPLFKTFIFCIGRWPQLFEWPDRQVSRWTSSSYRAWSQRGLGVLFVPLAALAMLATIPQGWHSIVLGLGMSAGIALFLWFFLSLGESWAKRYGGPTFFDSCLFVVLMGATLWAIIAALLWLAHLEAT